MKANKKKKTANDLSPNQLQLPFALVEAILALVSKQTPRSSTTQCVQPPVNTPWSVVFMRDLIYVFLAIGFACCAFSVLVYLLIILHGKIA